MDSYAYPVETDEETRTVSIKEAAERLSISYSSIKRIIDAGDLPTVVIGGRRLVRIGDLRRFLDARIVWGEVGETP